MKQNRDKEISYDILSIADIEPFLESYVVAGNIKIFKEIDSTSKKAKELAVAGAAHGTVILANQQTAGKGRCGKVFISPPDSGIYMSIILNPDTLKFTNLTAITAYAALCVCEAIESVCYLRPSIKWVNDIFMHGKKICGILTEAITKVETHANISKLIIGIGINVSTKPEVFPEILRDHVGSIYPDHSSPISRNHLAGEIMNRVLSWNKPDETQLFDQYKKHLFILGMNITVAQNKETYIARALNINNQGHLIVQRQSGEIEILSSGEVSVSL